MLSSPGRVRERVGPGFWLVLRAHFLLGRAPSADCQAAVRAHVDNREFGHGVGEGKCQGVGQSWIATPNSACVPQRVLVLGPQEPSAYLVGQPPKTARGGAPNTKLLVTSTDGNKC